LAETTLAWWKLLSLAGVANLTLWFLSRRALAARRARFSPPEYTTRRLLLWLGAIYALGCAFRSFLPMIDVPRLCLHDTPVSRIFIGRSVATIAELAFVAQWALLLKEAGARRAASAALPLIGAAEVLSWLAVLTTNEIFHAAENALWTLTAAIAVGFLASRWQYEGERARGVIVIAVGCAAAYVAFMLAYVVPMYLERWTADLAAGWERLGLAEGLRAVLATCTVDRDWSRWWEDALWLTPYFTLAVWVSLALPHVPTLAAGASAPAPPGPAAPPRRGG
jgi:hypothetical protein